MIPRRPLGKTKPAEARAGLERLRDELLEAKQRLQEQTARMRELDARLRTWDPTQPFQARRALALRGEATTRFSAALDGLHELLIRVSEDGALVDRIARLPRSGPTRKLVVEIRAELRYLQRAFDGGSMLLAKALEAFPS